MFGPFVTALTSKTDDEALAIANGTDYGRETGFDAMCEYTQVKSVWVDVDAQIPPWCPR